MEPSLAFTSEPKTRINLRAGTRSLSTTGQSHQRFRLMIVHDDSRLIENAIDDLGNCGLPANTELLLLAAPQLFPASVNEARSQHPGSPGTFTDATAELELATNQARAKLLAAFPLWEVQSSVSFRTSQVVIEEAARWQPDLIVIGSANPSGPKSRAFRSLLRKLVTESHFPIRVSRADPQIWSFRRPILIAFDGASGAQAVVNSLKRRKTTGDREIKLLFCAEPLSGDGVTSSEGFAEPKREWIAGQLVQTKMAIEAMGCRVNSVGFVGNTAQAILEQAQRMDAESIILGKGDHDVLTDLVAQSVAATVAANAGCPVEIVCAKPERASTAPAIAA